MSGKGAKFAGVELYFEDLEKAKKFYAETVGLDVSEEEKGHHAKFDSGAGFICLERKGAESYPSKDNAVLFFEVKQPTEQAWGTRIKESGPGGKEAADEDELAKMVGVVIGEDKSFVEQGLVVGVRDGSKKIGCGIFDFGGELYQVGVKRGHAFLPGFFVGRLGRFGPIARGEIGRSVLGIERVLDDVPLSDAKMLEEFPGRVRSAFGALAAKIRGEVFHRGVKSGVSVFAGEQREKIGAQGFEVVSH
jgi:predicted enzyme related to lactoylglutathione lyase